MKKPIIVAALALLAVTANAQEKERRTPEERARAHTERMAKELELSAEQTAQVEAINLKLAQEFETKRAAREIEREARKAEAEAMRTAHEAEMRAILNSDQFARWQVMRTEAMERHKQRREERREGK